MKRHQSASDAVAERVQELRKRQGFTAKDLAERCRLMGAPGMTASVIANIESGRRDLKGQRRRQVTLEEWLILAQALHVAPIHLLVPISSDEDEYKIVPEGPTPHGTDRAPLGEIRAWVRGETTLHGTDERLYYSEVPKGEWETADDRALKLLRHKEQQVDFFRALGMVNEQGVIQLTAGDNPPAASAGETGEGETNG
ncbi:helix-turn-helix transcriptional regulator [Streptomyces olivoreticuli]|uniref:helix-turn-helix domain-containing protein n=1 Tax=Streptomyces olivoreticuli TaxID=68246 RepID=UPI00265B4828|nr:helix-turn-helix transcriptional regulator [Streptomyces olivoreticuli]WKK21149.1 helix-turn-helix transcriptional regulator [Streptomyces olivoreticuli]